MSATTAGARFTRLVVQVSQARPGQSDLIGTWVAIHMKNTSAYTCRKGGAPGGRNRKNACKVHRNFVVRLQAVRRGWFEFGPGRIKQCFSTV